MRKSAAIAGRAKVLSLEQRRELTETFELFDTDGSGTMESSELRVVMMALGLDVETENIAGLISKFLHIDPADASDVSLTLDQFMILMIEPMNNRDRSDRLMAGFRLFDGEHKGKFGAKELRRVAKELNEPLSEEEILMILEELDKDGDGEIGADDWMRCMGSK
eukprot:jgi/Hompol1/2995/HPOL_006285-RA